MLGILEREGYRITDIDKADIGIVNTCGFIDDAKTESIDTILSLIGLKKAKALEKIVVSGCLSQRYRDYLFREFPEIDAFIGSDQVEDIASILNALGDKRISKFTERPMFIYSHLHPRFFITPDHYIYVKICEGCDNMCSYCVIPSIKGGFRSRPPESVIDELKGILAHRDVSEINIIGQDTTLYGRDLENGYSIDGLLKKIAGIDGKKRWIRLFYTFPSHVTEELMKTIASTNGICRYLDLPVQHINDSVLNRMNRRMKRSDIMHLIEKARKMIPGVYIRTSVIVGFPGEGKREFEELLDFIKDVKFDRLGAFTYSREEGTPAYDYPDQVPEEEKTERFNRVMEVQRDIANELNGSYIGKSMEVLIDSKNEESKDIYIARTEGDAPEVDGEVFVKAEGRDLKPGDFVRVKITGTLLYDLQATL